MTQSICFQFWVHISSFSLVSWRGNIGQHNRPGKWATWSSPHCPNCPSSTTPLRPNLDRSALGSNLEKSGKMKTVCTEVGVSANVFTDIFVKQNPTENDHRFDQMYGCWSDPWSNLWFYAASHLRSDASDFSHISPSTLLNPVSQLSGWWVINTEIQVSITEII